MLDKWNEYDEKPTHENDVWAILLDYKHQKQHYVIASYDYEKNDWLVDVGDRWQWSYKIFGCVITHWVEMLPKPEISDYWKRQGE